MSSIDGEKRPSSPFRGPTWFVNTPQLMNRTIQMKQCKKVCTKKNYTHIFCLSLDPNPRTSKMISFCGLTPQLTRPRSCTLICTIIVGVIQRNFLPQISNLWHKKAQGLRSKPLLFYCLLYIQVHRNSSGMVPSVKKSNVFRHFFQHLKYILKFQRLKIFF